MRRLWIDTDTASDDAVAILMALRAPDVRVAGISVVAGNVPVDVGGRNARYVVELCRNDVPVYLGARRPLLREPHWAYFFHGSDGMSDVGYPEPQRPVADGHGVDALIRAVRGAPREITLVTLGPLTNIALALQMAPDIVDKIAMCYVMGGAAACLGNITPAAEYNIWIDPEAARIVLHAGMKLLLVGWEHCRGEANLDDRDIQTLRAMKSLYADFAIDCNAAAHRFNRDQMREPGLALPDAVAMAVALDPALCTKRSAHFVDVETQGALTRGMTVVDALGVLRRPENAEVCWQIDAKGWKMALMALLSETA
jgi:purine nucleosidase